MTQHDFSTTLWTKLNYKRLKDLDVGIILLRKTKKKTNGRKRWASFIVSHPHINKWGGKQNKKQNSWSPWKGWRPTKKKIQLTMLKNKMSCDDDLLDKNQLNQIYTFASMTHSTPTIETRITWRINECLNIHKKKLEHRNIRTWSNPQCNWIF